MIRAKIQVPLLNANEPEARLVDIHVIDGQAITKGCLLFTIETTKATTDIEAPEFGFIRIFAKPEDTLVVGDLLAVIVDRADDKVDLDSKKIKNPPPRECG